MILNSKEISSIVNSTCDDPFKILGMHRINQNESVVRTFNFNAKKVFLKLKDKKPILMEKIDGKGLFEIVIKSKTNLKYSFLITDYKNNTQEIIDTYSFLPVISDYDAYLFNEGNHHRIYKKMGAHIIKHQGIMGTHFAVWAPNSKRVSVVGEFNDWDGRVNQMRVLGSSGIWEIFIPQNLEKKLYRFEIKTIENDILLKSDPYAFYSEIRPSNASIVYNIEEKHKWNDKKWLTKRREKNWLKEPISIYEVHLGSWARKGENEFLSYRDFGDKLVKYVKKNNYTHVEFMPIAEHPLDESWGYQVTGYFSATSRFGTPSDLMYLIDNFHQSDIGVIIDWVPGHFPKDAHGLGQFDGTALYEHFDPKQGEHKDWGTYIFNYGRKEVKNFLITNVLFWIDNFHIDGLRVDAVASMLYLDYSRKEGEWVANKFGGRENLEAIEFLKEFNYITHSYYPDVLTVAEESTAFQGITTPTYLGGVGFSLKWNMGWMHDTLGYMELDSIHRKYNQNDLTFSLVYAFTENFVLSISHDEVVYGKKSLLDKMFGDFWQKFANLRLFQSFMMAHPGKKLNFMGSEIGQWKEWSCKDSLDWNLLEYEPHKKLQIFNSDLNKLYIATKPLWIEDFNYQGFEWLDFNDTENSVLAFLRKDPENVDEFVVCIFNFTPVVRYNYRIGVPKHGFYKEILNTDSDIYFGSNMGNFGGVFSENISSHNKEFSIELTLPPLAGIYLKLKDIK